jgi:hypothetical protein
LNYFRLLSRIQIPVHAHLSSKIHSLWPSVLVRYLFDPDDSLVVVERYHYTMNDKKLRKINQFFDHKNSPSMIGFVWVTSICKYETYAAKPRSKLNDLNYFISVCRFEYSTASFWWSSIQTKIKSCHIKHIKNCRFN